MKRCLSIVVIEIAFSMFAASAAVVSVDIGQSVFGLSSPVDFDGDGTPELSFRGEGSTCTTDEPTSLCVNGVSIAATSDFEFLLQDDPFSSPRPLVEEDVLGDGSFIGSWGSTPFDTIHVSAAEHLLEPDRPSYPDYLEGIEFLSIGFRQRSDDGQYRYGWVDVSLFTYLFDFDHETILGQAPWPTILAAHYSDTFNEPVSFVPVPEPSTGLMLLIGTAVALKRTRRTRRG